MKSANNSTSAPALPTNGQDRRRSTRYRSSESLLTRCPGGSTFTGVSVEISAGGMSAMANGLMRVGDLVELEPVAGGSAAARVRPKLGQLYGFEFVELRPERVERIAERCKISQAGRTRAGTFDRNQLPSHRTGPLRLEIQPIVVLRDELRYI
jgi:hypothetical protein